MASEQTRIQTATAPRTVTLTTYFQSLGIAVLAMGIVGFIAGYFVTIDTYDNLRSAVSTDISNLVKASTPRGK